MRLRVKVIVVILLLNILHLRPQPTILIWKGPVRTEGGTMSGLNARIDDDLKKRFKKVCKDNGLNMSHFIRQGVLEKLQELEKKYPAKK